ncbi:aminopeptidase P family protein [Halosquirtibacter laminarini]|uniref:Aminopeptidase P family protein n=1 Tax=Halosquirtibacter laminarini TaxID=3374600 RepID=A0AC61NMI3_9BACT|nr:aminopeptidase P family protein [Prolixibacteraceae bacterium]
MNIYSSRISALRDEMKKRRLDAYVVYYSDPHLSEYMHDHFKLREWLTGFTGSYGFVVITLNDAALWTDSRYTVQAKIQLSGLDIEQIQDRTPDTPLYTDWLSQKIEENSRVGYDAQLISAKEFASVCKPSSFVWVDSGDIFETIASDIIPLTFNPILLHDIAYCGESRDRKIESVREFMQSYNMDYYLVSALDEIAWLLNLRGNDIEYNPVFYSYVIVSREEVTLYTGSDIDVKHFGNLKVSVKPYNTYFTDLNHLTGVVGYDPTKSTQKTIASLKENRIEADSPITLKKSIKNETEIHGAIQAHLEDGKALIAFWKWLEEHAQDGFTEYEIGEKLHQFRAKSSLFVQDSFAPIVGYQENGAIVHYSASKDSKKIVGSGLLLIDSGGQYYVGTTDITRTFAIGEVRDVMKRDYTNVLKGVIALSEAIFPKGYSGCHLDILARTALLKNRTNYGHGTGHGVGSFLNVHEGPMSIRPDYNNQPLQKGQVLSNEPGIYIEGAYGIRIENLVYVKEDISNEFGDFLSFQTLTMFPLELKLIDKELLTHNEVLWINNYHESVKESLLKLGLEADQEAFLLKKTASI